MINKIRSLLLGGADDNYLDILDKMKAIQDDAAVCKSDISAMRLRIQNNKERLDELDERLDEHEQLLHRYIKSQKSHRRQLSKTSEHFYDVLMDRKKHDTDLRRLGKSH